MRIGIDARNIVGNQRGFGRLGHLISTLAEDHPGDEFILFASEPQQTDTPQRPSNIQWEEPNRRLRMLHRKGVGWIGRRRFRDLDVFHFPTAEVWYSRFAPTVVTLHDLAPLHYPDRFFENQDGLKQYQNHLEAIVRIADVIVTVSEFAKQDIIEKLSLSEKRVQVIYQGFYDFSKTSQPGNSSIPLPERPYFLYCGGLDFRKNVEGLIRAFKIYRQKLGGNRILVIVGKRDESRPHFYPDIQQCAEDEGIADAIQFTGWIDDNTLHGLYQQAEAFIFPSLFEGFGYAPLEAMTAGIPVVCSNATSLPEVVGKAALLVDPTGAEAMAQAMQRITEDTELRRNLIEAGKQNLKRFNWHETARQFMQVYKQVAEGKK